MYEGNGMCTSSLTWNDCNLERNADFTLGGSPWYKASLVLGGTELDRDTWLIQLKRQVTATFPNVLLLYFSCNNSAVTFCGSNSCE